MSVLNDLLAALAVARDDTSNPDRAIADSFISRLNSASNILDMATQSAETTAPFAAWDRSVRALETLTGSSNPPPLETNIQAAQVRTKAAIALAGAARVTPKVISAVEEKPGAYFYAVQAASRAETASAALAAEMASAQQYLDYLAIS